jgi:hypothetical protein
MRVRTVYGEWADYRFVCYNLYPADGIVDWSRLERMLSFEKAIVAIPQSE